MGESATGLVKRTLLNYCNNENDCGECGRRELVIYQCTACPYIIEVPGEYHFYAQGRGHWHTPDDDDRFVRLVSDHVASHDPHSCIVPRSGVRESDVFR